MQKRTTTTSVPSRPAPAPPPLSAGNPHRYTPTTNWDDSPFDATAAGGMKKVPPPRPPPPKANQDSGGVPFKKATPQSVNILSNLFGRSSSASKAAPIGSLKLPPPPQSLKKHHHHGVASKFNGSQVSRVSTVPLQASSSSSTSMSSGYGGGLFNVGNSALPTTATAELIDWSSPPSSPTLTHKTNSDCMSVDSFSSDTNSNSSPQNGSCSQAESGFEDDFGLQMAAGGSSSSRSSSYQEFKSSVSSQITLMDPFSAPPQALVGQQQLAKIRAVPPPIAQKPKLVEQSAFYTQNSISFQAKPFDDPLSNGKSLIAPPPQNAFSMPTIIKPAISAKPIGIPASKKSRAPLLPVTVFAKRDSSDEEKTPSPPMPSCPPPPPPAEYFAMGVDPPAEDDADEQSYGIALYDYESEVDGDLSFREHEKIYLIRQENSEWMYGRSKRGCEGLFPANYVDIKVPLKAPSRTVAAGAKTVVSSIIAKPVVQKVVERRCKALFDFNAEADEDLSIKEGDIITIINEINEEWLMGRKSNGCQGQFPVAFVEYL